MAAAPLPVSIRLGIPVATVDACAPIALAAGRSPVIRVLVVEDHAVVRTSLVLFLEAEDDIDVVGEATNGCEAVALCEALEPDVVLMDVRMPVLDGIGATALIKPAHPATRVVLITAYEQPELTASGRECGADAFVFKGIIGAELAELLRTVAASGRSEGEEAA